jgi:hypothetical protein
MLPGGQRNQQKRKRLKSSIGRISTSPNRALMAYSVWRDRRMTVPVAADGVGSWS